MQMKDSQRIPASREAVWTALNDPEILKRSIPGCEALEATSPTERTATVVIKVGPVKAKFAGKVTLSDLDPPASCRITGEGSGGVAGFAKGGATVRLAEDGPDATILSYEVESQIGGKIAQLGARLIDSTAQKLAAEFFANFAAALTPAVPEAVEDSQEAEAKKGWFQGLFSKQSVATSLLVIAAGGFLYAHACCFGPSPAQAALDHMIVCGSGRAV